jgi:hypothetical protein
MSGEAPAQSPYEAVLGDALDGLHPRLRGYFGALPAGHAGHGHGVFDTVGTPRRWLRPLIRLFAGPDVLFPLWERSVPFSVVNSPTRDGGRTAVAAVRTFHFAGGDRDMVDLITATPEGIVDFLGARRRFEARFSSRVSDGALAMRSVLVHIRVGRLRIRVPGPLAPRVSLIERFDDVRGLQHVQVIMTMPLLGRVYEYAGFFRYDVREVE